MQREIFHGLNIVRLRNHIHKYENKLECHLTLSYWKFLCDGPQALAFAVPILVDAITYIFKEKLKLVI